jgi:DNA-damage-inducible protein J
MVLNAANRGAIMAQINIRIDDHLKIEGERLFKELGLTFSQAVSVFVSQAVRERAIPFKPTADPFYSRCNMAHLQRVFADADAGRNMRVHELIEVDGDD